MVLVVTTLCLYNKYCLSVRYENDCNEKRGRVFVDSMAQTATNAAKGMTTKKTWMEGTSLPFVYVGLRTHAA